MSEILVQLYDEDADPADVERLALVLRGQILEIPEVESVTQASAGPAPAGTRAVGLAAVGGLVVVIKPTVELLRSLVGVVQGCLDRGDPRGTMRLTINGQSIELRPTEDQQQALVDRFIAAAATQDA